MTLKRFDARLTEMNNYIPLSPGLDASKKMTPEDLNKIILHVFRNAWVKQSYLQGWGFEIKICRETFSVFQRIEISKTLYKGVTPSITPIR